MNPVIALLCLLQVVTAGPATHEMVLVDSCHWTTTGSLTDTRSSHQTLPLLKSEFEFSLRRHLAVTVDEMRVHYEELACRSVGEESGCPQDLALANHTVVVRLPTADADFQVEGITWPQDWTDKERDFALRDLSVVLALASSAPQISTSALKHGMLELTPGATLTAEDSTASTSAISGEFRATGIGIPLSGSMSLEGGRVVVKAGGVSPKQSNDMGQSTQDSVSLMCTREVTPIQPTGGN